MNILPYLNEETIAEERMTTDRKRAINPSQQSSQGRSSSRGSAKPYKDVVVDQDQLNLCKDAITVMD